MTNGRGTLPFLIENTAADERDSSEREAERNKISFPQERMQDGMAGTLAPAILRWER